MTPLITAQLDPRLYARLHSRRPLHYAGGADARADRTSHVRAGSSLAWRAGKLCVLQDDANFIALCDLADGSVDALALPRGAGGRRLFGDDLGNKKSKLDLEACVVAVVEGDTEVLVAFGSGSTDQRERLVLFADAGVQLIPAPALYAALRGREDFAGSELNIEGAVLLPDGQLRLLQRGNGAPGRGLLPLDATCELAFDQLWRYLQGEVDDPPLPHDVIQYDLGRVQGVRLTFTDGAVAPGGGVLYLAGAEDSPDTFQDGEVTGAAVGIIEGGQARWTPLVDRRGAPLAVKAEGLALQPDDPHQALVVLDSDDPAVPSELCEVTLEGPWWPIIDHETPTPEIQNTKHGIQNTERGSER